MFRAVSPVEPGVRGLQASAAGRGRKWGAACSHRGVGFPIKKERRNQGCSRNPRQGAKRTAPGPGRSLAGARVQVLPRLMWPEGQTWRFFGRQFLTHARHSSCPAAGSRPRHALAFSFAVTTQRRPARCQAPTEIVHPAERPFQRKKPARRFAPCRKMPGNGWGGCRPWPRPGAGTSKRRRPAALLGCALVPGVAI
jgi:hypothetical protein